MYLVLGDWSNDGHGKSDKILLESNLPVDVVQKAYKDSCKMTGVSFNHDGGDENFTGIKRDYQDSKDFNICTEYEDCLIPMKALEILKQHGWNKNNEDNYIGEKDFIKLWIWFVQIANPAIRLKVVKDDIPVINGYWNKELNVQFGYGLYS